MADPSASEGRSPLEMLDVLAGQEVEIAEQYRHVEIYTMEGLLTILWHGPRDAERVVLMAGGAMGGLLGPAEGLFHWLGQHFAAKGIGTMRVSYRRPNDLPNCVLDVGAAADLASRQGAERFVTMGHSFGGAVAIQAGVRLGERTRGVVTLATQSAGCEEGERLGDTPLLLFHGDADRILPPMASEMVRMIAGGELVLLPGADHLLTGAEQELRDRLGTWVPERLAEV